LRKVAGQEGFPLQVVTFPWSHGYPRSIADHIYFAHARRQGQLLAAQVMALRQESPQTEIYLVGHSAGCGVVLAAAEALPCATVDGILLLAPSLSADYDIRPALRCTRGNLDVFYSRRDWVYLALVTGIIGNSDRHWGPASGRYGFRPHCNGTLDDLLYARLRQHAWDPSHVAFGNAGGHYGGYQPEFLRTFVLPLFHRAVCPPENGWKEPVR
jgi:pimeloyl-ACP methyl ester carboxylesterase